MRVLFFSLVIIIIDQISKILVNGFSIPFLNIKHKGILPYFSVRVIGEFVKFTNVENPGIAFGWYFGDSFKPFNTLLTIAAVAGLVYYLFRVKETVFKFRLGIAMVIGGALGNLIDRIFYGVFYGYAPLLQGKVIDFIQIKIMDISLFGRNYNHLPIFNIADIGITLGVIFMFMFYRKTEAAQEAAFADGVDAEEVAKIDSETEKNENNSDTNNNDDEKVSG